MAPIEIITAGWYNVLYVLAVATAAGVMLHAGKARGWDSTSWGFAIIAWVSGAVIGAMLPRLILGDLVTAKTSLGAIAGGTAALAAAAMWLRIPVGQALDSSALALPLGGAVVRIGCYLAGCCHGTETGFGAMPVHPTQLYEAVLYVALTAGLQRWQRHPRREGSAILLSLAGIAVIRFVVEFVRVGEPVGPLTLAQWVVAPAAILALAWAYARERERPATRRPANGKPAAHWKQLSLVLACAAVAMILSRQLSALETAVIVMAITAVLIAVAHRMRGALPIGMSVLALQIPPASAESDYPRKYRTFGGGLSTGSFTTTHTAENCEGQEVENWSRSRRFAAAGAEGGLRYQRSRTRGSGVRFGAFGGTETVGGAQVRTGTAPRPEGYNTAIRGLSIAGDVDWKYVGLSAGGMFGTLVTAIDREISPRSDFTSFGTAGIRLGPTAGASLDIRVGDTRPSPSPGPLTTVGFAFGDSTGNQLRIAGSEMGFYASGRKFVSSRTEVMPYLGLGGTGNVSGAFHAGFVVRRWIRTE